MSAELKLCVCGAVPIIDILSTLSNNYLRVVCRACAKQTDGYLLGVRDDKNVRQDVEDAWNDKT